MMLCATGFGVVSHFCEMIEIEILMRSFVYVPYVTLLVLVE